MGRLGKSTKQNLFDEDAISYQAAQKPPIMDF